MLRLLRITALFLFCVTIAFAQFNLANPTADPAGIFDGNGGFSCTNYQTMASEYGTPPMIPERFGNSWTAYHGTDPALSAPTYAAAAQNQYVNGGQVWTWSVGTQQGSAGDYASNYAQIGYVYDNTVPGSTPGVDGIKTELVSYALWSGFPELYWAMSGTYPNYHGHPDIYVNGPPWNNGSMGGVVDIVRAMGSSEMAGDSAVLFQAGGTFTFGPSGNSGFGGTGTLSSTILPANFVPTTASITNMGEFLLVAGWNTSTCAGQLAVIAKGGDSPGTFAFTQYMWTESYPAFRNYSIENRGLYKLLGVINLPFHAPTSMEAVGNALGNVGNNNRFQPGNITNSTPGMFPLTNQTNWQCFAAGGTCATNSGTWGATYWDTGGFVLVASRYERKVAIYNLNPLFQYISTSMFSNFTNWRALVANTGTGAGQYPATFAENPSETPIFVTTLNFASQVTAVTASLYPDNWGFVATEDGEVHIFSMGGLQTGGGGSPIYEAYTIPVGRNITRLAHLKHWQHSVYTQWVEYQYIALSRGDKTLTWIDMSSGAPQVVKKFSDSRIVDPIDVQDNNNHGTEFYLIDICDYGDKNVKGYRYGYIQMWTYQNQFYTMGPYPAAIGNYEFEGQYNTLTGPFVISMNNVP